MLGIAKRDKHSAIAGIVKNLKALSFSKTAIMQGKDIFIEKEKKDRLEVFREKLKKLFKN